MADSEARDVRLDDPEADQLMVSTPELLLYLPKLLWYPLRGYGLAVTVTFGIALWIIGYAGVWGIPAAGIIFGWMGYYFMDVVQRTAMGHAIPPPMGSEVMFQGDKLRLGMLVAYLGGVTLLALSARHAGAKGLSVAVICAGIYVLPAYLASLALQPEVYMALNPLTLIKFLWHTGFAYFLAALLLAAVGFAGIGLAGHLSAITSDLLLVYGLIFVCHMVGYVAYHRQNELGIAVAVEKPTEESQSAVEQAQRLGALLAAVDKHLEANEPGLARDAMLRVDGADLANPRSFHEELFEALRLRYQDALSLVQAARLIRLLAQEKRYSRALDICEQCLDLSRDFLPEPAALAVPLAEQAFRDKRLKLFTRIADGVQVRHPGSDEAVSIQFLKAQALATGKQDAAALALVTPLLQRPAHPWAPRIQALHKALSGMVKPRS
ncbi:MAG TPA: hypothetical protein VKT74_08775 [Gammaproteobacteria bacterium]|nr:hypothetical protein [Gammaproteobacteria bacterium]